MSRFDKSPDLFPIRNRAVHLLSCGVAALSAPARRAEDRLTALHAEQGVALCSEFGRIETGFRRSFATLMRTAPENISFVRNTAEGLSLIANGYPFTPGDEVISYIHEYPSNHYPWLIQSRRHVSLKLVPDSDLRSSIPPGRPRGIRFEEIDALVTPRTRIIALSHVQFTSGFSLDLERLGEFCRARGIDFVVDCAQSLGSLPFYPERYNIAAAAGSGWKWLFGPIGSGVLYSSPEFRAKIADTVVGPGMMVQGDDFLNHTYAPYHDGRKFEYSTLPYTIMAGLAASVGEILTNYEPEEIRDELFRLQDILLARLDRSKFLPVILDPAHRSGILSLIPRLGKPEEIVAAARKHSILLSTRGGYLRIAPHFYVSDEEMVRASEVLNSL